MAVEVKKEYNIGLDIGTTSVGWSVVEANNQKVMRKGNKALWGVRLFDEATTAEARRMQRSTRRRYDRRRERINLLQEQFENKMNNVDKDFFQKLKESKYLECDKINKKIVLTSEEKQKVRDYQNKYKTIYHLREELVNSSEKKDIRLVYLAIHHIIKYRGNFLYQSPSFNVDNLNVREKLNELFDVLSSNVHELGIPEDYDDLIDFDAIEKSLLKESKNDTKREISTNNELIDLTNKNFVIEFVKLMIGNKADINKLLLIEDDKKLEINFSGTDYDDNYDKYQESLGENIEILDILKQIYDCIFLKKIFKGNQNINISSLMIRYYNQHKEDLRFLKDLFRNDRNLYNKIFRTGKDLCLYEKYITNKIDYDEFRKDINKLCENLFGNGEISINQNLLNKYEIEIKNRIENGSFLPRIATTDNGKYPYQLNKYELIKIIENQGKYYPFLLEKLSDDKTYKLVKLLEFRIPYYVGPLVNETMSKNAWLERKINGVKITPYNFDEIVDKEKTAEKFIKRMISHCTYLLDEYALANSSILYSKFKVMNELKQIRINDRKIELDFQKQLLEDFFMKTTGTITEKKFKNYLISSGQYNMDNGNLRITGYSADGKFANNMQSYIDFFGENGIFINTDYDEEDAEKIIEWITIFDDKDILEKKVRDNYEKLTENQIKKILVKKYTGWGRLSKKLLTTKYYKDKKTELYKSILDLMHETDENFMQVINNDKYCFQKMIQEFNSKKNNEKLNYSTVSELTTSPATKRGIYQALKVVEELVNYIGYEPKNIVIEMARGAEEKVRKDTRKEYIKKLYNSCNDSIENYKKLKHELDSHEITSQRLFLYFIQEGKCLYSGRPLNIEDIENQSLYEIDHIIPRTLIKDDSIDNKALVLRECNQDKKASYVLPRQFRNDYQKAWWKHLKDNNLISAKKFHNLVREKYSDEDIEGFINRQLVETRQITKHVANILKGFYKNSNIVYLKAELSHNYREKYDLFKFRDINDYHHAHDAYLAAVLGEYKENFMKKKLNFDMIRELNNKIVEMDNGKSSSLRYGFVINSLDENLNDIVFKISENFIDKETGEVLFDAHEFNKKVENILYRNDILVSRKTEIRTGQFYKETVYKKGKGNIPIKMNMPTDIYGGYSNTNTKKMLLIGYNDKDKKIIGLPMVICARNNYEEIDAYIKTQISLKKNSTYTILKECIPFESEILYNDQKIFVKGYSVGHKNCEISNAVQLKVCKDKMKVWKYAFQYLLNDENKYLEYAKKYINDIYNFLINLNMFPLFNKEIDKIRNKFDFKSLSLEQQKKIIKELFKMYHCSSDTANLSEFGLGDRMGRLSGNNITRGIIISKSVTGIRELQYEF